MTKVPTGIAGFDQLTGGGLPRGRTTLVVGGPLLIALIVRIIDVVAAGSGGVQIDGVRVSSAAIFGLMVWVFYLRFAVPVLAVFYGTSLMADEVDDKTITYLFSRPIPRGAVLLGKYVAYLVCTVAVVLPSVVLVYLLILSRPGGSLAGGFLDRDTDPDFAANVVGVAIADFLSNPGNIDSILADVEAKKATYTFESTRPDDHDPMNPTR